MQIQMQSQNLITALHLAIADQRKIEAAKNYTIDSGLVSGWVEVLEALKRGDSIAIVYSQ
jgi:hypothetical protein